MTPSHARRTVPQRLRQLALVLLPLLACCTQPPPEPGPSASPEAAYEEGIQKLQAGDREAARSALRRAANAAAGNTDELLKIGIAQSRAEDWPGCIDTYGALLRLDPRHAQALHNLGNVHFRQDRYEEAEGYYRRAVEAEPDYMLALYHHGWVLRQLNRPDEAIPALERCLALPADTPRERMTQVDCRFCLGTLRFRAGDHAAAASLMEQVLAEAPSHLEAHYYLGTSYVRLGRVEEGTRHLDLHRHMLRARRRSEPVERQLEP